MPDGGFVDAAASGGATRAGPDERAPVPTVALAQSFVDDAVNTAFAVGLGLHAILADDPGQDVASRIGRHLDQLDALICRARQVALLLEGSDVSATS